MVKMTSDRETSSMTGAPAREFDRAEYLERLRRVQAGMVEAQLDAVLVADRANYRYFSGHYTETTPLYQPGRPTACWLPASGEPVLVICEGDLTWAQWTSWSDRIVVYDGPTAGSTNVLGAPAIGFEAAQIEM